jgi:hypothetical protein
MKNIHKGIVFVVWATFLLSAILFGVIAVPFPQEMGINKPDIQIKDLKEITEMIENKLMVESQSGYSDNSIINQIMESLAGQVDISNGNNEDLNNEPTTESQTNEPKSSGKGASSLPSSRADPIVSITEGGHAVFDTVPGRITLIDHYVDDPLPLCIDDDEVSDWFLNFTVYGGYDFDWGAVFLYQEKNEQPCTGIIGMYLAETYDPGMGCCYEGIVVKFYVCEPICLDSNRLPIVDWPFGLCHWEDPDRRIPGKEVYATVVMEWSGCPQEPQSFKVLSIRDNNQFSCL